MKTARALPWSSIALAFILIFFPVLFGSRAECESSEEAIQPSSPARAERGDWSERPTFSAKISTMGFGFEASARISRDWKLRGGFDLANYSYSATTDGIGYTTHIAFRGGEAHLDWFPHGGNFHVSPGMLIESQQPVFANVVVPPHGRIDLAGGSYVSNPKDPLRGYANMQLQRFAPIMTVGWRDAFSRKGERRFTFPIEIGGAYIGEPRAFLKFTGSACDTRDKACRYPSPAKDVQQHVRAEQVKINRDISAFKVLPVVSLGVGYRF